MRRIVGGNATVRTLVPTSLRIRPAPRSEVVTIPESRFRMCSTLTRLPIRRILLLQPDTWPAHGVTQLVLPMVVRKFRLEEHMEAESMPRFLVPVLP